MICTKCECEYIDGITVCPDCQIALVTVEDFEGNLINPKDWVIIKTVGEVYEAEMYKANIEGAGIDVQILGQKDSSIVVLGDLSIVKIMVKKTDVADAKIIIEDIESNKNDG